LVIFSIFNFPLRPVGRRAGLQRADALREPARAVEQRRQLVVERIDLAAQFSILSGIGGKIAPTSTPFN